jgi:radical SAM superfamily enzyme YgiQ (UPF0313 family)
MSSAAFSSVFIGIESPSEESLKETVKTQNTKRSLMESIRTVQKAGFLVHAGFIIGFDHDTEDIFDRQIEFINQSGIPIAMVGLLTALPGTPLYKRLKESGRLLSLEGFAGTNDQFGYTNVVTALPLNTLLTGYRRVILAVYSPRAFFARVLDACYRLPSSVTWRDRLRVFRRLTRFNRGGASGRGFRAHGALLYRIWRAFPKGYGWESLRFLSTVLKNCPERLPGALTFVLLGVHFSRFTFDQVLPQLDRRLAEGTNSGAGATVGAA